jgi:thiol-disulfide isomerase/thioredoxin
MVWPVGYVDRHLFDQPAYAAFRKGLDTATIDPQLASFIGEARDGAEVLVFFGGWCPDSKREVPRFLKIADAAKFPPRAIKFYALDRTKKSNDGLTDQFSIERVPTFIFLRGGGEIGRIVETPNVGMEQDMLAILAPRRD